YMCMFCVYLLFLTIYFTGSNGQVTVTQTPQVLTSQRDETVKINCKTNSPVADCSLWRNCVFWYQHKPGHTPKLLIYLIRERHSNIPSRFSGNGAHTDFNLTISGVHKEDEAQYYCMTRHKIDNKYVFTQ
uniref:Ig-like domain-containing protein n=1 Tax=Sinocyclocheilus anshuiensis TaxID=1608454 RepID=A0A671MW47_9TELE